MPLGDATFEPDAVLFACKPSGAMLLNEASARESGAKHLRWGGHVHGVAGIDAGGNDFAFGMHEKSLVYGIRRG